MINIYQIIKNTREFKRFVAGFSLILLLFFTLAYSIYYNLKKDKEYSQLVLQSQEQIYQTELIISLLKDYETSSRGFVITNQDSYKQPFEQAEKNLHKAFVHLDELMAEDPVQKKHLKQLSYHIKKKTALSALTIKTREEKGLEEAIRLVSTNQGKYEMDMIREIVSTMQDHEKRILAERKRHSEALTYQTNIVLFSSLIILVVLLIYVIRKGWKNLGERIIAKAEKAEYQYRFKAILDYSPQAVLIKDLEGKHIFSNKAFLNLFDLDENNRICLQLKELFNDDLARTEFVVTEEKEEAGKIKSREFKQQISLPDGKNLEMEVIKFPLYDRKKQLFGICTLCKDITEQMEHQQQLIKARENAENAERLQEQFLANMSHELRTPMNGIIGMVNLLLTSSSLQPDQKGRLNIIKRSSDTLLNLINDILDLSKIKAGMLTIEKVSFDFNESIAGTALLFKERAKEKGIKLAVSVDPFIPRLLVGDPHRLNQILNNLLSNSIKFTDKGFVRLETSLHDETEDQVVVEFVVSDSGIGIDESNLEYIFENFSQASSDISSKYGGTGLGLAITKRLVQMQGGDITVESTKGMGTSFTFRLPFAISKNLDEVVTPYHNNTPVVIKKDYAGKKALIVEDNDINQAVLASTLKQHQLDISIVNNGREAINTLENGDQYDIIFMDLRMPIMNGFEATAYIRQKLHLEVPIVVLTASVLRNERDRCMEIGASDYMAKPFSMPDLARTLDQFLSDSKANQFKDLPTVLLPVKEESSAVAFDISSLLELEDIEAIQHVFKLIKEKIPVYLIELKNITSSGTWKEFLEKTHKIKGSLSSVKIPEIYQILLLMEETVQANNDLHAVAGQVTRCQDLFMKIIPLIDQEITKQLSLFEAQNQLI